MQVDFDSTYLNEETESQRRLKSRNKMISTHKQAIGEVSMNDAQDYEALTTLYRKIFRFLLEFAPNSKTKDKAVEREVAAALESVFPRVGLKSFIQLPNEEKMTQIMELARIVLGIRLFNKEEGRGNGGIDDMDKDSVMLSSVLLEDIERDIGHFGDACLKYQQAIVRAHLFRRRKSHVLREAESMMKEIDDDAKAATSAGQSRGGPHSKHSSSTLKHNQLYLISQLDDVNDFVLQRWSQELANRRQYLGFLRTLQDEVKFLKEKVATLVEKLKTEMVNVKSLVSNKSSVPKEMVYPRFDALGTIWLQLYEEVVVLVARSNTFQCLCKYRLSFSPTLADELHGDEDSMTFQEDGSPAIPSLGVLHSASADMYAADGKGAPAGSQDAADDKAAFKAYLDAKKAANSAMSATGSSNDGMSADGLELVSASGAQLLTIENTPDFAMLPLELQGYCPWTIAEAKGLLVPGKPALGIIRYENLYYVCDHLMGIKSFMAKPDHYLRLIRHRAMKSPEYIHLLRLQRWFPTASIAKLLQRAELEINNITGQPLTKDAATETPTHFVESYIDLNYHWNEWELRRRALKLVNLKNCQTTGQQTDKSNFRRENETQVYEPREQETQTKRDKGTNPPTVTTYVQGLRGKTVAEAKSDRRDAKDAGEKEFKPRQIGYPKVGVVTLTLDL